MCTGPNRLAKRAHHGVAHSRQQTTPRTWHTDVQLIRVCRYSEEVTVGQGHFAPNTFTVDERPIATAKLAHDDDIVADDQLAVVSAYESTFETKVTIVRPTDDKPWPRNGNGILIWGRN
jgi:hypothetical protein